MFPDAPIYSWVVLPVLIFLARITDVSVGTVRLILVSRGFKYLAPVAGFFEVLIWILVIGQIMQNLTNPVCYIAYAGGFATGNFVGLLIAEKLSLGMVLIRVITPKPARRSDRAAPASSRYGVTAIDGQGANGPVQIVFTIVPRREVRRRDRAGQDVQSPCLLLHRGGGFRGEGGLSHPKTVASILLPGAAKAFPQGQVGTKTCSEREMRPIQSGA